MTRLNQACKYKRTPCKPDLLNAETNTGAADMIPLGGGCSRLLQGFTLQQILQNLKPQDLTLDPSIECSGMKRDEGEM